MQPCNLVYGRLKNVFNRDTRKIDEIKNQILIRGLFFTVNQFPATYSLILYIRSLHSYKLSNFIHNASIPTYMGEYYTYPLILHVLTP